MTSTPNTEQFDSWNGDSGQRWVATADRRDSVLAPIADLLLHHAGIQPGEAVLDIGCGCGATTLAAAAATGPDNAAVGLDLSEPMLDVARRRAAAAGIQHALLCQGDAQVHRLEQTFDVAISRFGTMFFDDPGAAFTNLARHLRPGGRLCIATWQPLVANQWLTVPGTALLRYGTLPDVADGPGAPGMFAQADPATIRSVLSAAGFIGIDSTPHTVPLRLGATIDDAVAHLADSGPGRAVLETVPEDERAAALGAVAEVLADHHGDAGVTLDAAVWITTARIERDRSDGPATSTSSSAARFGP